MPKILRLSDDVTRAIAAGEVVERPASVLKELLENSLDAESSKITVEITGAGKKSLRVSDDGCGMEPEDLRLALERHTTSKISSVEDLEKLSSFGFRGEALHAISGVARLTLSSAPRGGASGWRVEAEDGKITSSGPAAAAPGTSVEARDLFHAVPARLKFLKSDATEKSALAGVFEEAALAHPAVHFIYKSQGRMVSNHPREAASDPYEARRRRLAAVLGQEMAAGLIPAVMERPEMKLWLFLSSAQTMNPSRHFQHWFVNQRPVGARALQQALYRAYQNVRSRGLHPICVGFIEMDPSAFDVNVHPAKREVRFRAEREMFECVLGLASSVLAKSKTPAPVLMGGASLTAEAPGGYFEQPPLSFPGRPAQHFETDASDPAWFTPPYRFLGQIEQAYLVFEASGGLFILDQHAAAERILFEKYMDDLTDGNIAAQELMLPIPLELPASRAGEVLDLAPRLKRLGFGITPFGRTVLHIVSAPTMFHRAADLKDMLLRLIGSLENPAAAVSDTKEHAVATMACKTAVKAHDPLGPEEALRLLEDLKDCRDGSCCPHGRRTMLGLSREELARRFQRPGAPPL